MSEMSREKALEVLNILRFGTFEEIINTQEIVNEALDMAIEALKERPHGEWIEKCTSFGGKCWAKCSVCNEFANGFGRDNGFGHDYFYPNFCPNCGADMRKEGERNEDPD